MLVTMILAILNEINPDITGEVANRDKYLPRAI